MRRLYQPQVRELAYDNRHGTLHGWPAKTGQSAKGLSLARTVDVGHAVAPCVGAIFGDERRPACQ